MTVEELMTRFPEVPGDLREEPLLARFASELEPLLLEARRPGNCSTSHDAANAFYLALIGPLSIYRYGLSSREKVLGQLRGLLERRETDPEGFAASLLPPGTAEAERKGPGCA